MRAFASVNVTSQDRAISVPPPMQTPRILAMVGLWLRHNDMKASVHRYMNLQPLKCHLIDQMKLNLQTDNLGTDRTVASDSSDSVAQQTSSGHSLNKTLRRNLR